MVQFCKDFDLIVQSMVGGKIVIILVEGCGFNVEDVILQ